MLPLRWLGVAMVVLGAVVAGVTLVAGIRPSLVGVVIPAVVSLELILVGGLAIALSHGSDDGARMLRYPRAVSFAAAWAVAAGAWLVINRDLPRDAVCGPGTTVCIGPLPVVLGMVVLVVLVLAVLGLISQWLARRIFGRLRPGSGS
jgi:hypothetical protein